jgi:putative N6-adenine-specific DNA methylase
MEKIFAVSAPGLEAFTKQELENLQLLFPTQKNSIPLPGQSLDDFNKDETGGVEFDGDLNAIYKANLLLRTASRVLVRFGEFYAAAFSELEKKSSRLSWERYLTPGQPIAVRVTCHKSRLYHSNAAARTLAKGIGIRLGNLPPLVKFDENGADPPQLIVMRLVHDLCTISIDSSGAGLHRRGYRLATAKAPLRETLAAGVILASGWDCQSPLLDPFCGSGTIPIEAALIAREIPAGSKRRFAFYDWPGFNPALWEALLSQDKRLNRITIPHIIASDRDAGAIEMAQANAERAGVADCIEFSCRAVSAIEPSGTGWVVTNPPYGVRVSAHKDLRNLYAQFGKILRQKCSGWHVAVLCSDLKLLGNIGLPLETSFSLVNGGLPVKLARGIVAGK